MRLPPRYKQGLHLPVRTPPGFGLLHEKETSGSNSCRETPWGNLDPSLLEPLGNMQSDLDDDNGDVQFSHDSLLRRFEWIENAAAPLAAAQQDRTRRNILSSS